MGRPRSGSENRLRDKIIPTRVDNLEKAAIAQAAKQRGLDVSELMRSTVLREIGYSVV